jgi:hypothetical protein
MKPRERILAICVAALVVVLGLRAALSYIDDAFTQRQNRLDALTKQISDKEFEITKGDKARSAIVKLQKRSLPTDRNVAGSLYHNWLLQIAEKAGVSNVNLTLDARRGQTIGARMPGRQNASPAYERIGFTLDGEASLKQIVGFLYEFYSASHLQRITLLDIAPARGGSNLDLKLTVEALILPGADRTDKLSSEKSDRLVLGNLAAYEKAIVGRNLFAEYTPPRPPVAERRADPPRPQPKPPAFDQAKHATVTGIVEQGDQPQLWVLVKTTGELLKLAEGEEFSVGDLKCKVVRIGLRDAELTTGEKHFVVKLQDNLRDAAATKSGEL